jgi:hypothetical protein
MAESSGRFALPYLQPGQAQKEFFHNEALTTIDALLHPVAQTIGDNIPPSTPAIGQCWIIGPSPTGAWTGHGDAIAYWSEGGWRFIAPTPGMMIWLATDGVWAREEAGAWAVSAAIPDPAGGTIVDIEARAAINALLAAVRSHGLIAT